MEAKKKFIVAITGVTLQVPNRVYTGKTCTLGRDKLNIVTYLSPVISCYNAKEAFGIAMSYFTTTYPDHFVFDHTTQEI